VYSCKQCSAAGKNTPLEWIPQYQRWYCRECRQYAPSSASTKTVEDTSQQEAEEVEEDEDEVESEFAEESIQPGNYTLGFAQGSRVDDICFNCRHLMFTENNTRLKCGRDQPYFSDPAIAEVTIRPIDGPKCRMGTYKACLEFNGVPDDYVINMQKWREYIENQVRKQILSHEKDAASIEMYRIEFIDTNPAVEGAKAVPLPIKRENVMEGRVLAVIDKPNKKVWVYAGVKEPGKFFTGFIAGPSARLFAGYEDPISPKYLRDLLKREIRSFAIEKMYLGKESSEFWSTIDRGALVAAKNEPRQVESEVTFEGPILEMYQIKFDLARYQREYYTGGRSASETKWIVLNPLRTSTEEFDRKKMVLVIDHGSKIVWLWIGSKSARVKTFIKARTTMSEARRIQLATIGSQIGRNVSDYEYMAVEEGKEPELFQRLLTQINAT
jgi:hypothetical protein